MQSIYLIKKLRFWLAFTLLFMAVGVIVELVLLSHFEDIWQIVPVALVSLLIILVIISFQSESSLVNKGLSVLLILCALSGLIGIYFHLNANWEFESEMHPGQSFYQTFIDSLSGALPALAPASMMVLSLIGYIYLLINHENN